MTTDSDKELKEGEVITEQEGGSDIERLLRTVILGYATAYNKHNEKNEIKFTLTITTHKVATPDGNKDVAYLRLDRYIREKDPKWIGEEGWTTMVIHQEVHYFKDIRERVNPKQPWKEQLYMNALGRIISAGLEYAELLKRLKMTEENKKLAKVDDKKEIIVTNQMPAPLTQEDEKYKDWLKEERKKEGL